MKVSVRIVTYNHEKFIIQAIDSVLAQKVNFDYEIVIGEDCSTDNTRNIVIDYQKKYPRLIRLLLAKKNLGAKENVNQTLAACRGEYIALLDGDDYWTSSHKLQKQVDFLDSHPECVICFHNAIKLYDEHDRQSDKIFSLEPKQILTIKDILDETYILPVTAMFRNGIVDAELPKVFDELIIRDWVRFVLLARHGNIGYIDNVMGVYRIHRGGIWSRGGPSTDNHIRMRLAQIASYEAVNKYLDYKYNDIVRRRVSDFSYALAKLYKRQKNWKQMRKYVLKGFGIHPFNNNVTFKFLVKSFLISILPGMYHLYCSQKDRKKGK